MHVCVCGMRRIRTKIRKPNPVKRKPFRKSGRDQAGSTPGLSAGSSTTVKPPFGIRQGDKTTCGTGPGAFHFWHALASFLLSACERPRANHPPSLSCPY